MTSTGLWNWPWFHLAQEIDIHWAQIYCYIINGTADSVLYQKNMVRLVVAVGLGREALQRENNSRHSNWNLGLYHLACCVSSHINVVLFPNYRVNWCGFLLRQLPGIYSVDAVVTGILSRGEHLVNSCYIACCCLEIPIFVQLFSYQH